MASYADWIAVRSAILAADFVNRTEFLSTVRYSVVRDPAPLPDSSATRALLALQALKLVPGERVCESCSFPYTLVFRAKRYCWRGSRSDIPGCPDCHDKQYQAASIGFLHHVKQCMWMTKLECFVLSILEYPRQQIVRELHPARHDSIDSWIASFQETLSSWFQLQMSQGFDSALSQELLRKPSACKVNTKKPAASYHVVKKPSSRTAPAKKPASSLKRPSSSSTSLNKPKKMHLKYAGNARIFIADETHLNRKKPGALSRSGRPERDQIWLWGAVLHGHVKTHFIFRILKNAADAHDGKPRGHQEMKTNLSMLGMKSGEIFVSDKWKATLSALKAHRELRGLSEKTLRHEIVNHSQGEIVNQNGFSTNAIECKWSLIKRWIRTRLSGTLPRHNDREKWRLLIDEYQARSLLKGRSSHTLDRGNMIVVSFHETVKLFRVA